MKYFVNTDLPVIDKKIKEICNLILRYDDVTLVSLPRTCRTYLCAKLQDEDEQKTLFTQEDLNNLIFLIVDLSLSEEMINRLLDETLSRYSNSKGIMQKIKDIIKQGKHIVFVIDNFTFEKINILTYLTDLRILSIKHINYMFLSLASDFYTENEDKGKFSQVYRNIIKVPYLTREEAVEWMSLKLMEHEVDLTTKDEIAIWEFCGGIPSLIKHFVRLKSRYDSVEEIINSDETHEKLKTMWLNFTVEERETLKTLLILRSDTPETNIVKYFRELNLVDKNNNVIGEWVNVIAGNGQKNELILNSSKEIIWGSININELLTGSERKVLQHLIKERNMAREEVAKILWGEFANTSYSDYAIDQTVSRLRKKLDKLKIGGKIIKTVKKVGFQIS